MTKKYILASINICTLAFLIFLYIVALITINPFSIIKSLIITLSLISLLILTTKLYFSKKQIFYNIGIFITILLNVLLLSTIQNYNKDYQYIQNIFNQNYKYTTYNIYVQKKNPIYNNITKLSGKKIGTLKNNVKNINSHLKSLINIECITYNNISEIEYAINNGEIQSFILSEDEFNKINEDSNKIKNKVRTIYRKKIKDTN